jgi:hypothetical protein
MTDNGPPAEPAGDDPIYLGALRRYGPVRTEILVEACDALTQGTPKLSPDEIEQIANRVTDQVLERLAPTDRKKWRVILLRVARDLALGIAASALWALLATIHPMVRAGPSEREAREIAERDSKRREAYLDRVPLSLREQVAAITSDPQFSELIFFDLEGSVPLQGELQELSEGVAARMGHPLISVSKDYAAESIGWALFTAMRRDALERLNLTG